MPQIRSLAVAVAAGISLACLPSIATAAPPAPATQPSFTEAIPVASDVTTGEVVPFDVDGDGLDDLVHLSPGGDLTVRIARTRGRFRAPTTITVPGGTGANAKHLNVFRPGAAGTPVSMVFVSNQGSNPLLTVTYDPSTQTATRKALDLSATIDDVHVGRFGTGGNYAIAASSPGTLRVLPLDYATNVNGIQTFGAPAGPIGSFDLDADGDLDLVAGNNAQRQFTQFRNTNGSFMAVAGLTQPTLEDSSFPNGPVTGFATLDVGGDGRQDLVLTNHVAGDQSYMRLVTAAAAGQTPFDRYWYSGLPTVAPTPLLVGDFDGNGMDDIAWNYAAEGFAFFQQGSGIDFLEEYQGALELAALQHQAAVGDLNGDGKSDIVAISATRGIDLYLSNAGGDQDPPTITLDSAPPSRTNQTTAEFAIDADEENLVYECRVDGGAWIDCSATPAVPGLAEGSHTASIRAIDEAGNRSNVLTHTWTVDTTAPSTTIASVPDEQTASQTAAFTFTSDDSNAVFECRRNLDGGSFSAWAACTSPLTLTGLAEGDHRFEVRAVDVAGNIDASPAAYSWTVDWTAPGAPTLSEEPPLSTNAPRFLFTGEDDTTFECRVDAPAPWVPCTSPFEPTITGDGQHTVEIRQVDAAGNRSDVVFRTFALDTEVPAEPTLTEATEGDTSTPRFVFAGETGAEFACRIDNGEWEACTSPHEPTDLSDGPHRFDLRQIDPAGNESDIVSRTFTLDTTAPAAPAVLGGPTGSVTATEATFTFAGEPGGTFLCSLDGGAFAPCSSPLTLTGLGLGAHHLRIVQTDAAGNEGAVIDQRWEVVNPPTEPTGPAPGTREPGTPQPVAPRPTKVTPVVAPTGAARGATVPVGCRVDAGRLERCTVTVYLGSRVVGTGTARFTGDVSRGQVDVRLNAAGQRAIAKLGGAKLRFRVVANDSLRGTTSGRVLPETTRSVPSTGMFPTASARMTANGQRFLRSVARDLRAAKAVTCIGHTDSRGGSARNQRLGQQRAAAVCAALRRSGVKATLRATSRGESQPRATNATAEGRALNRRVVLVIRYR